MDSVRLFTIGAAVAAIATLGACGSGGDGGTGEFATGVFKDSNVSGVSYRSNGIESITGDGRFTYEVGTPVRFWIGNVDLGSTTARSVVTPLDLVAGGSSTNAAVQNRVRFLMMLDTNNNPSDGIAVSFEVSQAAANWSLDFASPTFDTDVAPIVTEANAVDPLPHSLPTAAAARTHLETTLRCVRAGGYRGRYRGDDTGPFGVLVSASTGQVSGYAWSTEDQELLTLNGTTAVSFDQGGTFISGDTSSGSTFQGGFAGPDRLAGTWANTSFATSGSFSGDRIGGLADARHRFTGTFAGDAYGLFTFDVADDGTVQGVAYTVYSFDDGASDETASFTGTLTGTTLVAEIRDGGEVDATLSGTMNTTSGSTSGTWSDNDGNRGNFTGTGCRLN